MERFCKDLDPTGGMIKQSPEDFLVEEIPAYEPSGSGSHLFLWIEKKDLTGDEAIRRIARAFGVKPSEVGTAGTKDRRAITKQYVSVPTTPATLPDPGDNLRILSSTPHTNRLRTGHLRGNRFCIRIRATDPRPPEAASRAAAILDRLAALGLPNFFGPQRFGRNSETSTWGIALLKQEKVPSHVTRKKSLKRLALSAAQSLLYNDYLFQRISSNLYRKVIPGDVLKKTDTGGLFNAEPDRLSTEQDRLDSGAIVHAGPIFGRKTFPSHLDAHVFEQSILEKHALTPDHFKKHGKLLQGTRRPDIVYPQETSVEESEDGITLTFTLPSGSYATILLAEVTGHSD